MRIASNKISALLDYYRIELLPNYNLEEVDAMFQLVVEHYLNTAKKELPKQLDKNLNHSELLKIYDCCKEIKSGTPVQYVLEEAYFLDFSFKVNPSVLIPRPETEELLALILKENKTARSFLDIGTGSACIPISIKRKLPGAVVSACDISESALSIANENSLKHKTDVNFFKSDVLDKKQFLEDCPDTFDVIVSNPPYILSSEKILMETHVLEHEPHLALFVEGNDPIVFYKSIIDLCEYKLQIKGKLYFELNPLTALDVKNYAEKTLRFSQIELIKDMSGKIRFLKAEKK